jgi:type IV pilus assembly protein PilW
MAHVPRNAQGLSMVELLVAMAISLVITLAAIAALTAARRGFDAVDEASQLRDNLRFSSDLIYRLASQTGYKDIQFLPYSTIVTPLSSASVEGFNNARYQTIVDVNTISQASGGLNGSDILVLRTQGNADESLIDCMGRAVAMPLAPEERSVSVLHVQESLGQPTLMCASRTRIPANSTFELINQPLIQGVENFQVLYGVDANDDSVADRFLRANQITTQQDWRRVRSLRIGLVVRGAAISQSKEVQVLYPFGKAGVSVGSADGSALSSANDPGSRYTAPADGRLRQALTFTVHLRNDQTL